MSARETPRYNRLTHLEAMMIEALRGRWSLLLLLAALILTLRPHPTPLQLAGLQARVNESLRAGHADRALLAVEGALDIAPEAAGLHSTAARLALLSGQPERALAHLAQTGTDREARCLHAQALAALGDLSKALDLLPQAGRDCHLPPSLLRTAAAEALRLGDAAAARRFLETWTRLEPANPQAHLELGLTLSVVEPPAAVAQLQLAQDLAPQGNAQAWAMADLLARFSAAQEDARSWAALGEALTRLERWDLAAIAFQRALHLDPDFSAARAYLGLALDNMGRNGYPQLKAARDLAPNAPLPRALLGMHWLLTGRPRQALQELEIAVRLDPENPAYAAQLGAAYAEVGQVSAALESYRRAAELGQGEPSFWLLLAQTSLRLETRVQELGLPAARNALVLDPESAAAMDSLGYAHLLLGHMQLAERLLYRALQTDPTRAETYYHWGLLQAARGLPDRAQAALEAAQQLDPEGPIGELALRTIEGLGR